MRMLILAAALFLIFFKYQFRVKFQQSKLKFSDFKSGGLRDFTLSGQVPKANLFVGTLFGPYITYGV